MLFLGMPNLNNKLSTLLLVLVLCLSFPSLAGGGWTQKKGEGFFFLHQRMLYGNQFFLGDGSTEKIATTGVYFTTLYGEYGITNRLTALTTAPLFVRITKNAQDFSSGLYIEGDQLNSSGDLDLGLKYGIVQNKPVVVSISLLTGWATGNAAGGESRLLQAGDGENNQQLRLDVSGGLNNGLYLSSYVGFNNRTRGFSDEFHYGGEVGYAKNKLLLMLKMMGIASFYNGKSAGLEGGLFSNNIEYLSVGLEGGCYLNGQKSVGVLGGVHGAFFAKNVLAVPSIHAGIFYQIKK